MRTPGKHKLDYADYAAIPDDGNRYEVLEGGLLVTPAPSPRHQLISFRLHRQLVSHFGDASPGVVFAAPIDVILSDHDILQPDLVVADRPEQVSTRGIEGAPLLVVEILSPATRQRDRTPKARRYAALGVPHFWLVDPDARRVECYRSRAHGTSYSLVVQAEGPAALTHPDWANLTLDLDALWR
jgi:Uma2 family endonuclease